MSDYRQAGPDSTGALPDLGNKKKRVLLILGVLVLLGGAAAGAAVWADRSARGKEQARLDRAWSSLDRCLLGEVADSAASKGTAKQPPSQRFRTLQLANMGLEPAARSTPGKSDPWPTRCYEHAFELDNALKAKHHERKDGGELANASREFAEMLKGGPEPLWMDLTAKVDRLYKLAREEGVNTITVDVAPAPPGEKPQIALASAPMLVTGVSLQGAHVSPHVSDRVRFIIDAPSRPAPGLCTASPTLDSISCVNLPMDVLGNDGTYRLLGGEDEGAEPLVFAGKRGASAIVRGKEKIGALMTYGSWSSVDGFSAVLGWDETARKPKLIRKGKEGLAVSTLLDAPGVINNYLYNVQLLDGLVIWKAVLPTKPDAPEPEDSDPIHLFVQPISTDLTKWEKSTDALGIATEIGTLDEASHIDRTPNELPHIVGCKSEGSRALRVKGWNNEFVSLFVDGSWKAPLKIYHHGEVFQTFGCRKNEATVTSVVSRTISETRRIDVEQVRCTASACTPAFSSFKVMTHLAPTGRAGARAIELMGKTLVVWHAGPRGGLRMRLADPAKLADAKEVLILDDLQLDGTTTTAPQVEDFALFSRGKFALVLLETKTGLAAIRIADNGQVTSVKVSPALP